MQTMQTNLKKNKFVEHLCQLLSDTLKKKLHVEKLWERWLTDVGESASEKIEIVTVHNSLYCRDAIRAIKIINARNCSI